MLLVGAWLFGGASAQRARLGDALAPPFQVIVQERTALSEAWKTYDIFFEAAPTEPPLSLWLFTRGTGPVELRSFSLEIFFK